jgi:hypothetical protein
MAYPAVSAPYGLIPINLIGGQVFAGATRLIPIASNYGTSIFYGDVVRISSDGVLVKETGTSTVTATGVVGVFLGCTYTNPSTKQPIFAQYYPANTVASDIQAYVADDPDQLFKVAVCSSGTTIGTVGRTAVGQNTALIQNSGSTTSGNSGVAADDTTGTTISLPLRIVDVVEETATGADAFTEIIVKWNAPYPTITIDFTGETASVGMSGGHQYLNPTGV